MVLVGIKKEAEQNASELALKKLGISDSED